LIPQIPNAITLQLGLPKVQLGFWHPS
jgi:hypothetical protein